MRDYSPPVRRRLQQSSAYLLSRTSFLLLTALLFFDFCGADAQTSRFRTRDFQSLTDENIRALVQLDPPEWDSVTEGHLGKILIPRVGESFLE